MSFLKKQSLSQSIGISLTKSNKIDSTKKLIAIKPFSKVFSWDINSIRFQLYISFY